MLDTLPSILTIFSYTPGGFISPYVPSKKLSRRWLGPLPSHGGGLSSMRQVPRLRPERISPSRVNIEKDVENLGDIPYFRTKSYQKPTCMGVINLMEFICSMYIYIYIYVSLGWIFWGEWYWVITVCMIPGMNMKTSGLSWYLQSWRFVNLLYYRGFDKRGFSNVSPSGKSTIKMTRSNTKPMFLS